MLKKYLKNQKVYVLLMVLPLIGAVPLYLFTAMVYGANIENRSVRISTSVPSAAATHEFKFDIVTPGTLGSVELEYCSNDPFIGTPCTAPAGFSASGASLASETGETGFIIHPTSTANKIILSRVPAAASAQPVSYSFSDVINPSTASQSVYVRISTFASDDATGPRIDEGAVVFSTSGGLGAKGYVPPFLIFCVGLTVSNKCSAASGNSINLGELSSAAPRAATSQFSGATNDVDGYSVSILGITMTSGNNTIPAMTAPAPSNPGTGQYGINLRANTNPAVGQNFSGVGVATIEPQYNIPNQFVFQSGTKLVSSTQTTDFNTFTVSYIVNVSAAQPAGVYNTTATYVATAAF